MRQKKLSTLGFIMECLDIQTVSLARALHVDASLVSKWKSGDRSLTGKSTYFQEVITYLMEESAKSGHQLLRNALRELYPHEEIGAGIQIEPLLRQALTKIKYHSKPENRKLLTEGAENITLSVFEGNAGRRTAIERLLKYAEGMATPGKIVFIDSEEYEWLLEDMQFAKLFALKMECLLKKGFRAQFVIHYSSYRERFVRLFETCSSLIFHRNVEWFYYEYYDENVFNFSFFILNHAVSLLGLAAGRNASSTMLFFDNATVIRHEGMADYVINNCRRLFINFRPNQFGEVVNDIYTIRKRGALYSFLPAPAFLSAKESLLEEVMKENGVSGECLEECLTINRMMREITHCHFSRLEKKPEPFIHILQLEEMVRRAKTRPFISCSLTLLGGKVVKVSLNQYAACIRSLAEGLEKHENLQIVLVSEEDHAPLPGINCWCKQNTWMVQMDEEGFRLSDEISIVNAASVTLERCVRRVPPERKEKAAVRKFLLELADELEYEGIEENLHQNH